MSERNGHIDLPTDEECDVVIRVGTAAVTLDLYDLYDLFISLGHKHRAAVAVGDSGAYYAEAKASLAARGLSEVSRNRQVADLRDAVYARVDSLSKKDPAPSNSATQGPAEASGSGSGHSPQETGTG